MTTLGVLHSEPHRSCSPRLFLLILPQAASLRPRFLELLQGNVENTSLVQLNGKEKQRCEEGVSVDCCKGNTDLTKEVEKYLTSISHELNKCTNPTLKNEHHKLLDLLSSYRKLCARLRNDPVKVTKCEENIPEIYTVLYPEIYKNVREEEKERLRSRLAKRRVDRNNPRSAVNYRPQTTSVPNPRQTEKDRFIKIVATAPSVLLNVGDSKVRRSVQRETPKRPSTLDRDREKERLARIFSTDVEANPTFRKKCAPNRGRLAQTRPSTRLLAKPKDPPRPSTSHPEVGMVRKNNEVANLPRRLPGSGDKQDERRKKMLELKNKEYQEYVSQARQAASGRMDKSTLAREASILEQTNATSPRSVTSVSTQTDSVNFGQLESPTSRTNMFNDENVISSKLFPVQKEPFITSPRAKLIKDLHGVSPCLPGASPLLTLPDEGASDEKLKQMLYAEALKAQIEEKKKLEEEKRKKELEEEELIEKKAREQQERLKMEYEREQSLRQDWLLQRQEQEENLRKRLLEMEQEAKELKRRERVKRSEVEEVEGEVGRLRLDGVRHEGPLSPRVVQELIPRALQDVPPRSPRREVTTPDRFDLFTPLSPRPLSLVSPKEKSKSVDSGDEKAGERPPSPVLPAVQTDTLLKRSQFASPRLNLKQVDGKEELLTGDKILTQLGLFRREMELEQERLQQRLQQQES